MAISFPRFSSVHIRAAGSMTLPSYPSDAVIADRKAQLTGGFTSDALDRYASRVVESEIAEAVKDYKPASAVIEVTPGGDALTFTESSLDGRPICKDDKELAQKIAELSRGLKRFSPKRFSDEEIRSRLKEILDRARDVAMETSASQYFGCDKSVRRDVLFTNRPVEDKFLSYLPAVDEALDETVATHRLERRGYWRRRVVLAPTEAAGVFAGINKQ